MVHIFSVVVINRRIPWKSDSICWFQNYGVDLDKTICKRSPSQKVVIADLVTTTPRSRLFESMSHYDRKWGGLNCELNPFLRH